MTSSSGHERAHSRAPCATTAPRSRSQARRPSRRCGAVVGASLTADIMACRARSWVALTGMSLRPAGPAPVTRRVPGRTQQVDEGAHPGPVLVVAVRVRLGDDEAGPAGIGHETREEVPQDRRRQPAAVLRDVREGQREHVEHVDVEVHEETVGSRAHGGDGLSRGRCRVVQHRRGGDPRGRDEAVHVLLVVGVAHEAQAVGRQERASRPESREGVVGTREVEQVRHPHGVRDRLLGVVRRELEVLPAVDVDQPEVEPRVGGRRDDREGHRALAAEHHGDVAVGQDGAQRFPRLLQDDRDPRDVVRVGAFGRVGAPPCRRRVAVVDDATTGAFERSDQPGGAERGGGAFEAGGVRGGARRHAEDAQGSVRHPVRLGAGADTHPASPNVPRSRWRTSGARPPRGPSRSTASRSLT